MTVPPPTPRVGSAVNGPTTPAANGRVSAAAYHPPATTATRRQRGTALLGCNRDYTLLWSGQLISAVGSQVSLLALPILIFALTRSPAATGIASALRGIPYVVLMLPAGALVDRWDRRRVDAPDTPHGLKPGGFSD